VGTFIILMMKLFTPKLQKVKMMCETLNH
jgi:hypothetical protein